MREIVIAGGGTGGHLSIAKAIKEELVKRGVKPVFIGSLKGQDRTWFEGDEDVASYFLQTQGVVDKGKVGKIISLAKIAKASYQSGKIFQKFGVTKVFSVGGYSAAPASLAALLTQKELFIHEQNAVMGRLNRLLSKRADAIFSPYLKNSPVRDYPVREIFFQNARERKEVKTILFLGGSQGAHAINLFAKSVARRLFEEGITIIHQSGERDYAMLKDFYEKEGISVDLFAFSKELDAKVAQADFAISRAGASTLWELVASKLPALYIPYPYAAEDHQYYNAKFLEERGASFLKREEALTPALIETILEADIASMSKTLEGLISPDGAAKIVDYMGF